MSKLVVILVMFFILFCSCSAYNEENKIKNWIGREMVIPLTEPDFEIRNTDFFSIVNSIDSNNLKLLVAINGECGTCIHKLKAIEDFVNIVYANYKDISLYVYISSPTTKFYNFELLNESIIKFQYPVIYDRENDFLSQNRLPSNEYYHILLCDKDNKVIMIGDFTQDENLKNKYMEEMALRANPVLYDSPIIQFLKKQ